MKLTQTLPALLIIMATSFQAALAADKLAVMPFSGPNTVSIDPDILWKAKTGMTAPSKDELSPLPARLSEALARKLSIKLGQLVVSEDEMKKGLDELGLAATADKSKRNSELAKKLNAAYIVDGNVDRLEFDGNTVMHDKYAMFLTVKLIPTSTADAAPLWKITNKKFYKKIKATKGRSIVTVFTEEQIPEVASTLSEDIAQALGR